MRSSPVFSFITAALLCLSGWGMVQPLWAAPELPADDRHRGVIAFGKYQLFPENRPGNAVYLNHRQVISLPGRTIVDVLPFSKRGRFVYLAIDAQGQAQPGAYLPPGDPAPRIRQISEEFFHMLMVMEGVVYKKLYRVADKRRIVDVLPRSKTADGMAAGDRGVFFYHVAGVERAKEENRVIRRFRLGLHVFLFQEERLRNLDYPIVNTLPRLRLVWKDDLSLEYTLADGRVELLSLAQFR